MLKAISKKSQLKKVVKKLQKRVSWNSLVKKLDKLVSDSVKKRTGGKCDYCGQVRKNMGTSHYFNRNHMGTRWEYGNLDWFCWLPCHTRLEKRKNKEYRDFMIKKLGPAALKDLEVKADAITKFSTMDLQLMITNFDKLYK